MMHPFSGFEISHALFKSKWRRRQQHRSSFALEVEASEGTAAVAERSSGAFSYNCGGGGVRQPRTADRGGPDRRGRRRRAAATAIPSMRKFSCLCGGDRRLTQSDLLDSVGRSARFPPT